MNILSGYGMRLRICVSLLIILPVLLSITVDAEKIGNITVYVKDQNGDDVAKNSHLVGNLTVELWYEGVKEVVDVFNKSKEFVFFPVNHTGLYTVTATTF